MSESESGKVVPISKEELMKEYPSAYRAAIKRWEFTEEDLEGITTFYIEVDDGEVLTVVDCDFWL